jgi:hypothetical protein
MTAPRFHLKNLDDLLTPEQAALWLQQSEDWVRKRIHSMPGWVVESRQVARLHPRTYLESRMRKGRA